MTTKPNYRDAAIEAVDNAIYDAERRAADAERMIDLVRKGDDVDVRALRRLVFLLLVVAADADDEIAALHNRLEAEWGLAAERQAETNKTFEKSLESQSLAIAIGEKLRAEVESLKARLFAEEAQRTHLDGMLTRIGNFAVSREAREPRSFTMFGANEITGRDRTIDHLVSSLAHIAAVSRGEK